MTIEISADPANECVRIAGELTIYTVAEAKTHLQHLAPSRLDLAGVAAFDGAGLQLMMALHRDAEARMSAASDCVQRVLRLAGAQYLLSQS
jgi:ABC-type transporter Mla MlaB component